MHKHKNVFFLFVPCCMQSRPLDPCPISCNFDPTISTNRFQTNGIFRKATCNKVRMVHCV